MSTKCKCHGLSASCELKTCWPKMPTFRQTGDVLLHKFKAAKPVTPDNSAVGSFLWLEERTVGVQKRRKTSNYKRNGLSSDPNNRNEENNFDPSYSDDDGGDTTASNLHRRAATAAQEEVLVYTDSSPNLCKTNRKMGILGTRGRLCNGTTSSESSGSCDYLCCGRGYAQEVASVESNCRCRFQWCCEVICERCVVNKSSHHCI